MKSTTLCSILAVAMSTAMVTTSALGDGLPDGYTQLPYIKANRNVQVKTGYTPKGTDKIVMTWTPSPHDSGNECLWCARSTATSKTFTAFDYYTTRKIGIHVNTTSWDPKDAVPSTYTANRIEALSDYTKYTLVADGNAKTFAVTNAFTGAEVANYSWTNDNDFEAGSQLCLFASHGANINSPNNWASHFLYSFKVYDKDGNLKLDLVPAKNASGTVGLYDAVGDSGTTGERFKTKSNGTGSLSDTLIDKTFDDDFTLLGDEVFGKVTVAAGKTLDLNGHRLTVGGLAGDGTITAGLQDLTSPDPNGERVTQTGTFYGSTKGSNLFNDNYSRVVDTTNRVIVQSSKLPISVTYDFGAETPQKVDCYKIYCGTWENNQTRGPKTWTFEGERHVDASPFG